MINWKNILKLDLGALMRGKIAVAEHRPRRRRGRSRRSSSAGAAYRPGLFYRYMRWSPFGRPWAGPYYRNLGRWQRDLLDTMNQLSALVRTNANLVEGLEKAAEERRRQHFGGLFYRLQWYTFLGLGIVGLISTVFPGIGYEEESIVTIAFLSCCLMLAALLRIAQSGSLEAVLLSLRDDLAEGLPLSTAMHHQRRMFPRFYVDMVRAGEDSGRLAQCLNELSDESLRLISLRANVRHQFMYLGVLVLAQCAILAFILTRVMPVFAEIHQEFGGALPRPSQWVVAAGDFVIYNWTLLLPLAAFVFGFFYWFWRRRLNQWASRPFAGVFMGIPALRRLVQKQNLAMASLMLSHLTRAGVPLPLALSSLTTADLHLLYRRLFQRLEKRVAGGMSFGEACAGEAFLLPATFRSYANLGERSGMLPDALQQVGEYYREETLKWTRILSDTVTPAGVLCLGALTLFVLSGLYIAIWQLSDVLIGQM